VEVGELRREPSSFYTTIAITMANGAHDEFLLAATAQNLCKHAKTDTPDLKAA
jgi:hypothetical protein